MRVFGSSLIVSGLLAVGVALFTFAAEPDSPEDSLEPLKWRYRIVLVDMARLMADPDTDAPTVAELEKEFSAYKTQNDDRHIRWFVLGGDATDNVRSNGLVADPSSFARSVRRAYFSQDNHAVVLIGKDGGLKYVDDRLDLPSLHALIDGMPMRRREMQGR